MKLDLHTHCWEATSFCPPTVEAVRRIVTAIKDRALAGIAITDHVNKSWGYSNVEYGRKVKEIVESFFDHDLIIIPGQEVGVGRESVVELWLPNDSTFRFWAHPCYLAGLSEVGDIQGIELKNGMHGWDYEMNDEKVREIAERHDLLLLCNSDAHYLDRLGEYYNEIDLEELRKRAKRGVF